MSKLDLDNLVNLQNETTAVNTINNNNNALNFAFENTLSRDGTQPNQMVAPLDMNSNQIINLPFPNTGQSPVRLDDFNAVITGQGNVPAGGLTGQILVKHSNTNFDTTWVASPVIDIRNFAVAPLTFTTVGTGLDDTATLQAAVDTMSAAGGGTIRIPTPLVLTITSGISLVNKINIRIAGDCAGRSFSNAAKPAILYTAASGSLFTCDGVNGFEIDHLRIQYTNVAYNGDLLDLGSLATGFILSEQINIHHNYISGQGSATNGASLINLTNTLSVVIDHNFFQHATQCIRGGLNSNNINISNNWFNQGSTTHIGVRGEGWVIASNTFEPSSGTVANNIVCNGDTWGLTISGNTFNDGLTGTQVVLTGGIVSGLSFTGNDVQGGSFSLNAGPAIGVSITGNAFIANNVNNLIVSAASHVFIAGNSNSTSAQLIGTFPINPYFIDLYDGGFQYVSGLKFGTPLETSSGGTGLTALGTGVSTFLSTPSSANLRAALTDETGTGPAVFGTSPNITTPTGLVKGDVGLGNVDNTSDTTKWAATATLTNKTYDTAGTGNSFLINGLAATANTGTGAVVRATSPTLVTPILGTPASGVATNLTGTAAGLTAGNVTTNANLTGDVTSVGNATTIGANKVTRAMEAQGVARSVIGVTGNATANVADIQGTANQFLGVNSAGTALAFQTMSGDAVLSSGAISVTKTGGVSFGTAATQSTGTSGANIPLLNAANTWSATQTNSAGWLSSSPSAGIGYTTGAGGSVTQLTSRTTAVSINDVSGDITLFSAAGVGSWTSFTVNNSAIAATDTISLSVKSATNTYVLANATAVAAGSFQISFIAVVGTATDAPVFNFNVIKGGR